MGNSIVVKCVECKEVKGECCAYRAKMRAVGGSNYGITLLIELSKPPVVGADYRLLIKGLFPVGKAGPVEILDIGFEVMDDEKGTNTPDSAYESLEEVQQSPVKPLEPQEPAKPKPTYRYFSQPRTAKWRGSGRDCWTVSTSVYTQLLKLDQEYRVRMYLIEADGSIRYKILFTPDLFEYRGAEGANTEFFIIDAGALAEAGDPRVVKVDPIPGEKA